MPLWQRMQTVPRDPLSFSFRNKVPWSFNKIQNNPARDIVSSHLAARCSDATRFLPTGGQLGVVCHFRSLHSTGCTRMRSFLYLPPFLWAGTEVVWVSQFWSHRWEHHPWEHGVTLWSRAAHSPWTAAYLWTVPWKENRSYLPWPMVFLGYSHLDQALTNATLLHLTRIWGNI